MFSQSMHSSLWTIMKINGTSTLDEVDGYSFQKIPTKKTVSAVALPVSIYNNSDAIYLTGVLSSDGGNCFQLLNLEDENCKSKYVCTVIRSPS